MCQNFSIKSSLGGNISVTTYGNSNTHSQNCIVLVNGFMGFKDWGYVPYFGKYFSNKGFFVITFNFSHSGIGENKFEITELEKFANNTFTREITELNDIIEAYQNGLLGEVNSRGVSVVGHSRGGAIAMLAAPNNKSILKIVTWGSVATLDRYSQKQKERFRTNGFFEIQYSRTKRIRMNLPILDDLEANINSSLNIKKAVGNLSVPLLIIHGSEDVVVKPKEAIDLYNWSNKELTELKIISRTGHTFGCKDPFEGSNAEFEKILKITNNFINTNLN
jgi:pimeloyl-ACP methyl ester carboxylesterase